MEVKMICMDLDGTALQRDRSSFSPALIRALEEAHRQGIAIVPVTGRQYGLLPPAVKNHPVWENLVVTCNGGQIRKLADGELLSSLNIEKKALHQLLKLAEGFDLPIEFSLDSKLHLTARSLELQQDDPGLVFHRDTILANHGIVVDSLTPLCEKTVEKVNLLCIPEEKREAVLEGLKSIAVSAVWSSHNCMEITHPAAHKGRGLEEACRLLDIPVEATMALGDSGNDIAMLRRAGLGVAMGNAPEFVKAEADAVTGRYDADGAAEAIRRYALNETGNHPADFAVVL